MKPADIQPSVYIDYCLEHYDKDPKFKVGDYLTISEFKKIIVNG